MSSLPQAILAVLLAALAASAPARAQTGEARRAQDSRPATGAASASTPQLPAFPAPAITHHNLALPGRALAFTATVGAQRILDAQGAPESDIVVTAFTRDGADPATRPVTFAFNGGPGASSAWLQLGAIGPWRLPMEGAALAPSAPPIVAPNAETWLDFSDLVFIDPVGTGFSRFVSSSEDLRKRTWSVDGDVTAVARIIRRWLAANERMTSPKFVLGESYGGIRGPRVVRALQTGQGIGVDGLILVSPLLDYGGRSSAFDPLTWVEHFPSMVAAAREAKGPVDRASLADAESYAAGDYLADLLRGEHDPAVLDRIGARVAGFIGVDEKLARERAGRIDTATFLREARRETGEVRSPYDATEAAPDPFPSSLYSNHPDRVLDGLRAPFTSAMLDLYARELKFLPDLPYEVLNNEVARDWDLGRNRPESASMMRGALALDPRLRLLIVHGLTDLVTPYFATQLILNQFPAGLADRVKLMVVPGGHMFYARDASRAAFREAAKALYPGG